MSGIKKHIDEIFRDGLKNFSLLVSNKDLEAIDDKTSVYKEQENPGSEGLFGSFEIEVGESDWLSTKAKLENEKAAMAQDHIMAAGLKDLEMDVRPEDWTLTYRKLRAAKKRRLAYWWLSAGVVILALGIFFIGKSYDEHALSQVKPGQQAIAGNLAEEGNKGINGEQAVQPGSQSSENKHANNPAAPDVQAENNMPQNTRSYSGNNHHAHTNNSPSVKNSSGGTNMYKTLENGSGSNLVQSNTTAENIQPETGGPSDSRQAHETFEEQLKNRSHTGKPQIGDPVKVADLRSVVKNDSEGTVKGTEGDKVAGTFEEQAGGKTMDAATVKTDSTDTRKKDEPPIPPVKTPKTRLYVGLVGQAGSTFRHLDKMNSASYNAIRNSADKAFTQFTYGIEAGVQKKKSRISLGFQSTSQSWASNYKYSYRVYDSLPLKDPNGHIIGYFLVRGRDTLINESQMVRIEKVQIPFEFTQMVTLTPKLDIIASAGGVVGFNTKSEGGKMINPENNYLYNYNALKDSERDISFAPMVSLGAEYKFNPSFSLQGVAFGNYSLTSRFTSSFPAKEYAYTVGASVKLLYFIK